MKTTSTATIRPSTGQGGSFAPVVPGYYNAVVSGAEKSEYEAKYKGQSGQFTYIKLTPEIELLNDAKTKINRQDITFGTIDAEGALFRPDGDENKPALFSDAGFFLQALGFVDGDGNIDLAGFHPALVAGQVIRVKVDNKDYDDKNGQRKTKNVISGYYSPREEDVQALNLYFDGSTGMVFLTPQAASDYAELKVVVDAQGDDYGTESPF